MWDNQNSLSDSLDDKQPEMMGLVTAVDCGRCVTETASSAAMSLLNPGPCCMAAAILVAIGVVKVVSYSEIRTIHKHRSLFILPHPP